MTGKQCDTCSQKYNVPVDSHHGMHCERKRNAHTFYLREQSGYKFRERRNKRCVFLAACDSCVIVLLEDLDKMNDNFHSVADQLKSLNASSMAWAQLNNLNKTLEDVAVSAHTHTHTHTRIWCDIAESC